VNVYGVDWDFALVAYRPTVNVVIIQVGVSFTLMYEPRGLDKMHRRRNKLDEIPPEQRDVQVRVMLWRQVNLASQHTSIPQSVSLKTSRMSKEKRISARSDLILHIYMHHERNKRRTIVLSAYHPVI
jgi:hypothetical protein